MLFQHSSNSVAIVLFLLGNSWRSFSGRIHDLTLFTSSFSSSKNYWGNCLLVVAMSSSDFPGFSASKVTGGTFFLVVVMSSSDFPDFWTITGNCLYLFSWPLVVMSSVAMVTSYFPYVGGVCHTTSIFWRGVSGEVCIVYGSPISLFVIEVFGKCLLTHCGGIGASLEFH